MPGKNPLWPAPILIALAMGCSAPTGAESPLPSFDKSDGYRTPTLHGDIWFGDTMMGVVTEDESFHAWDFNVHGDAEITILGRAAFEMVVYLYRYDPVSERWGSYIARSDIGPDVEIVRSLEEGQYRILVKGYTDDDLGGFSIGLGCNGSGCHGGVTTGIDAFTLTATWTCGVGAETYPLGDGITEPDGDRTYNLDALLEFLTVDRCADPSECSYRVPSGCWSMYLQTSSRSGVPYLSFHVSAGDSDTVSRLDLPLASVPTDGTIELDFAPDNASDQWGHVTAAIGRVR